MDKPATRIAIASGKGGTGKTTVATNLAFLAAREGRRVAYLDCDVEEPNGHIFLQPTIAKLIPVSEPFPHVDREKCDLCGRCNEVCQFSAIVRAGQQMLVYPDLCHGCGGCELVCPMRAITEAQYQVVAEERNRYAEHDVELVERHHAAALRRRCDLGDIHRRNDQCRADTEARGIRGCFPGL